MSLITWLIIIILVLNTTGAIFTVLREVRDISTTWAWLLVLIFLPIIGFGFYLFAGRGLSTKKLRRIQREYESGVKAFVSLQKHENARNKLLPPTDYTPAAKALTAFFLNTAQAPVLAHNQVQLYTDGEKKFAALFRDIESAKHYIYVEYYTIYNDELGNQFQQLLIKKAKQGVTVKVLYDAWGSMGASAKWWRRLTDVGGQVESYFSSKHPITDFRLNYRDHRKIVVIDDHVGYIGGFNVGDQYVSRKPKFGYWRDTHLRIIGNTIYALKIRFTMDWNATVGEKDEIAYNVEQDSPGGQSGEVMTAGSTPIQIVASGPDRPTQQIKLGYTKLITSATKSVWIQSPYLVPDDTVIDALVSAAMSSIDVRIMIPDMPDHPFIFRATQYYATYLARAGVKIYHYQHGFMHAKTVVVDDAIASVGSANFDIRSFKLNFEVNAFIYDRKVAGTLAEIFEADMKQSYLLTPAIIASQSRWLRFKQDFSRLLSPIL
ncbi:cardiolipin synthase [Lacticaseibacillus zeae]|uniref:Cardiolipin synthase n=1 Tax=Lacticaseibacillus zeae TaxID=57037 RepID=A0A5R8LS35_LACZE|nr:cardiolipin synthase [Lacticaseibacillus zeae]TLF39978.1 cardiolipin synthase [Lacticaseibacillus zeae]